ncbi:MAG: DMT family transporter [Firmicutes bacterium]|nr:DMT family transporter [Bacillota bacterium]
MQTKIRRIERPVKYNGKIFYLLMAAAAGSLMAIQGTFNSLLGKVIGLLEGTFSVHLLGAAAAGLLLLFLGNGNFAKLAAVPWFAWLGGPIGVAIIFGVAFSIPRLGVGVATTAIIGAQLLTAYLIDHFGLFGMEHIPFNLYKLLGIILIVCGSKLLLN